ncbi:MAG: hypothetical protein ACKVT2_09050 [Saprospiraceae bacterium]
MNASTKYLIRRSHRFLGVTIGIQFLLWTAGGLYFSWSDMDEVHGDYEKAAPTLLASNLSYISPNAALDSLQKTAIVDSLAEVRLVSILGKAHWQITFFDNKLEHPQKKVCLADALTGSLRPALTENEAVLVAQNRYAGKGKVKSVEYLTEAGGHHEYRENPLPALAVTFDDPRGTTVYVATELGTVQKFRNRPWRQFDFLWMLHTMDYVGRDHITNWLLRAFSIFGLLTVTSGFTLFFISRKKML